MASFGENLKRQRELRGIELREISEATKISFRFLQALEADRIDVLPGGIFRRSFVREYSRYLGLDTDRLVAEFMEAYPDDKTAEKKPAPHTPSGGFYRRLFIGLVLLSACGGLSWSFSRPEPRAAIRPAPAAPARLFPEDRLIPGIARDAATAVPAPAPAPAATEGPLVLTLTAREECWVRVEVEGRVLMNEVLASGRSETLQADNELLLSVGNAAALDVRINDRPAQALGGRGEVRKNIVINKESLPSLVDEASPRRTAHSG
jgi:cytoskeletal protein RodZ